FLPCLEHPRFDRTPGDTEISRDLGIGHVRMSLVQVDSVGFDSSEYFFFGMVSTRIPRPIMGQTQRVHHSGFIPALPMTFAGRQFYRTFIEEEFLLSDMATGEVVFSFLLPLVAINSRKRNVASYAIKGVQIVNPTKQWERKHAEYVAQLERRQVTMPEVFSCH